MSGLAKTILIQVILCLVVGVVGGLYFPELLGSTRTRPQPLAVQQVPSREIRFATSALPYTVYREHIHEVCYDGHVYLYGYGKSFSAKVENDSTTGAGRFVQCKETP